jgi:hypothetical protein
MKWDQARANMPCDRGRCDKWIAPGQAFRWMAGGKLKYCVACAYASTKEQPPPQEAGPRVSKPAPLPTFKRFVAPTGLDARAKAARNDQ